MIYTKIVFDSTPWWHILFSEQLWRYGKDNKLINKVPELQNKEETWSIPNEEGNGNIENSGKVLGLRQKSDCSYGNFVTLQARGTSKKGCNYNIESDTWFRSKQDDSGYFTLQNLANGMYLTTTAKKKKNLILTSKSRFLIWYKHSCNISVGKLSLTL